MKQHRVIVSLVAILYASCSGQRLNEKKVPSIVVNTLKTMYPSSTAVDWKKSTDFYEAEIDLDKDKELTVRIDAGGKLLMQKQDILTTELSPVILGVIQKKYTGYAIDDLHKIDHGGQTYYQVGLEANRKKDIQVVLTPDGKEATTITYWD